MGGKGGSDAAEQIRQDEQERQERIRQGTAEINSTFDAQFTDIFFQARRDAYLAYAKPQLEYQYGKAQREFIYWLSRTGNFDSSVRGEKSADLQQAYDLQLQKIADQAIAFEGQARNAVEDARANLIIMVNSTSDAEGAANAAIARSAALTQPAAFDPLSNLFADFLQTLGVQAAQERAEVASFGAYKAKYNTGLFGGQIGLNQ